MTGTAWLRVLALPGYGDCMAHMSEQCMAGTRLLYQDMPVMTVFDELCSVPT